MKKLNLIVKTTKGIYENCGFFEVRYKKGIAKELCFSYNGGKCGININPADFISLIEKNTEYNFSRNFTHNVFLKHGASIRTSKFNDTIWESELKMRCPDKWEKLETFKKLK